MITWLNVNQLQALAEIPKTLLSIAMENRTE